MDRTFLCQAAAMVQRQHRRRNRRRAFTAMAAVVVFVTVYMLILPAITLERTPQCGKEEHVHTDECYAWELVCTERTDPRGELICGQEETEGHTHTDACLAQSEEPEAPPDEPEEVPSEPAPEPDPVPAGDGSSEEDTDAAVSTENGDSDLQEDGNEEVSTAPAVETKSLRSARSAAPTYVCGQEERPAHHHTDACYASPTEGAEAHQHTEACYRRVLICGKEEHVHTEECYHMDETEPETELDAEAAPEYICGLEEHTHTDACCNADGALTCGLEEHAHTAECLAPEEPEALTGTRYRRVDDLSQLETGTAYALVGRDGDGTPYLVSYGEDGMDVQYVTMEEGLDEDGQPCAVMTVEGAEESESLPPECLWFAQNGEALETVKTEETASTQLNSVTVPEKAVDVATDNAGGWTVTDPDSPVVMRALDAETEPVYDIEVYAAATTNGCPSDCALDAKIDPANWVTPTGTNPFGTAQEYNLFLLGDMTNWGEVHGNAAIWGNINGTNQHITYNAGSLHDYSAYVTPKYEVGLILGGEREAGKTAVTVRNGSTISTAAGNAGINMDIGLDEDHRHIVASKEENLDPFFEQARTDLLNRNEATFDYATGLQKGDTHLGSVNYLTTEFYEAHKQQFTDTNVAGIETDLYLIGSDPFYNVFNLTPEQYSAVNGKERNVYLDVPFGSYVVINIIGDRNENGTLTDTTIDSFAPLLRYKDSNNKFIDQPADKSHNDNYTQTQRVLVNFDPEVEIVTADVAGYYLYASVMGPNAQLHVPETANIHIQGTVVLEGLKCDKESNNSSIIYNPFIAGGQITWTKNVLCDTAEKEEDTDCFIEAENGKGNDRWAGYYVDVTLESVEAADSSTIRLKIPDVPMNGKDWVINGITPGEYRIVEEAVYQKQDDGTKVYLEPGDEFWQDHGLSEALFFDKNTVLVVKSGEMVSVSITNHYAKGSYTSYAVNKKWLDDTGKEISAPENAEIELQLYQNGVAYKKPVVLSTEKGWSYVWSGLPKADADGAAYEYTVKEIKAWPGFGAEETQGEKNGVVILYNKQYPVEPNSLMVEKLWYDENGNPITGEDLNALNPNATVSLYQQSGTMKDKTDFSGLPTITVQLEDGTKIGEPYRYFPGSDVDVSISYWYDGQYQAGVSGSYPILELLDGTAKMKFEQQYGISVGYQDSTTSSGYAQPAVITGKISEANGNKVLVLKQTEGTHKIIVAPVDNQVGVTAPAAGFTERPTAEYIDWSGMEKVESPPGGELGTVSLPIEGADDPWRYTWTMLPVEGVGTNDEKLYYRYYVIETLATEGFKATYLVNGGSYTDVTAQSPGEMPGVTSGFITIKNQKETYYELPETGGIGTAWYRAAGALVLAMGLAAAVKPGKEGRRRRPE